MPMNIANASGLLKEFYTTGPAEQLNNSTPLMAAIEKDGDDVNAEGSEAVFDTHMRRNYGVAFMSDGGTLPTPGNQQYVKGRVPLRTLAGRLRLTVQVMAAAASSKSAFEKAATAEMKGIVKDLKRQAERSLHGTSDGVVATTGTTTAANVVVLAATTTAVQLRQLIDIGQVDIGTVATPTSVASSRTVTAVDRVNKTITISGAAVTTAAGANFVFLAGSGGSGTSQVEFTGVQSIASDTGVLHAIDPAVYPLWAAYNDTPAGAARPVTENLFERAMHEVAIASEETPVLALTSHGVYRSFSNLLTSQKRFTGNERVLTGGFKGLAINAGTTDEAVLTTTRDAIFSTAFFMNPSHLKWHTWQDWGWMDQDGAILSRTQDQLAYESTYFIIAELATDQRNAHGRVGNLIES